ncbi:hypothetical protein C6P45_005096 [Maudiozyma exigua]|uniref:Multicopper oxidase n=1 Tax=Maudiozyma exigua TaxID=34358 RepID=A0A9P6W9E1_MAUEX|nr:hypothetical protein C6P45_005096 [Kazachstania exigua]
MFLSLCIVLLCVLVNRVRGLSDIDNIFHDFQFDITSNVDTTKKRIISINGKKDTYGPVIKVNSGDTFMLKVKNNICSQEELNTAEDDQQLKNYCTTTLHFHGLIGIGNTNDGVPYLTQDPINSGEEYVYNITVPQDTCGTFWYHSHSSVQYGDGLRGIMVVNCDEHDKLTYNVISVLSSIDLESMQTRKNLAVPEPFSSNYDKNLFNMEEKIITLSDTYDEWGLDILKKKVLSYDGGPDPLLTGSMINGNTKPDSFDTFPAGTEYIKLRIVNSGLSGTQVINFEHHNMVVVETDGTLVEPYILSTLSLAVGQRYTVIIKLKNEENRVRLINGCNKMMGYFSKSLWLVSDSQDMEQVISNTPDSSSISIRSLPQLDKHELFRDLIPIRKEGTIQRQKDITSHFLRDVIRTLTYDYRFFSDQDTKIKYGTGMYKMNGKTLQEYQREPTELPCSGRSIEIIINSIDHMRHPWHLHGHQFQLVSIGNGREGSLDKNVPQGSAWDKYQEDIKYWEETGKVPSVRDSINIPGSSFAVIRFNLDSEGTWLMHCHVEWHMAKGLGFAFKEHANKDAVSESDHLYDVAEKTNDDNDDIEETGESSPSEIVNETSSQPNKLKVLLIYFSIMFSLNGIFYFCMI